MRALRVQAAAHDAIGGGAMTPYRAIVFASGFRTTGKGKRAKTVRTGYAYVAWNPNHTVESARLLGSGSFLWPGIHAVRRAALNHLILPGVEQVSIRTNQDREVFRFYREQLAHYTGQLALPLAA